MSHKVRDSVPASRVWWSVGVTGGFTIAAAAVGTLAGILGWKSTIANGMYHLAAVAAVAAIATIHARHVTRHNSEAKEEMKARIDKRFSELRKMIKFAAIYEVDQYLQEQARKQEGRN